MGIDGSAGRRYVRTFFSSPTAVADREDSAAMLRHAIDFRGMQAPDVWVPDFEDATAPSMRQEGIRNVVDVVSSQGADFPGEIHPRILWHRDDPRTRYEGFQTMLEIADPDEGAIEHIDGFVVPEVGDVDDWKRADEYVRIVESEHGLGECSLSMSVVLESAAAELALDCLREEMGKPSNTLQRLFLLVVGEIDYTRDMRAMTPSGAIPSWPELRHSVARGASAAGLVAIDGAYDDIRDLDGYRDRMAENRAKGISGIWSLTPSQVVEANTAALPPVEGTWLLSIGGEDHALEPRDDGHAFTGGGVSLDRTDDDRYQLGVRGVERDLDEDELREELLARITYLPSLNDVVDSIAEFESAKEAGTGAIAVTRSTRVVIDGVAVDVSADRMWDEATLRAHQTPIALFRDVYEHRPDQRNELEDMYGSDVVERALDVDT